MDNTADSQVSATTSKGMANRFRYAYIFIPVLIICITSLSFVQYTGIMPDHDYWLNLDHLLNANGFHITLQSVYNLDNVHEVAIPKLVFLANMLLTAGNNQGLAYITCILSLLVALLLASALMRTYHLYNRCASPYPLVMLGIVAGMAAFVPLSAFSFFSGMNGVIWVSANVLVVGALYTRFRYPDSYTALAVAIALCLLSAQCFSTGLPALLLLGIQALLQRHKRREGVVLLVVGAVCIMLFYLLVTAPALQAHEASSPWLVAKFATLFIGGGLTTHLALAATWGAIGLLLFAWMIIRALWHGLSLSAAQAFWVVVGGYAICAAVMAGIGRVDTFGLHSALSGRYATVPVLFWVALAGLALTVRAQHNRQPNSGYATAITTMACAAAVTAMVGYVPRIQHLLAQVPLNKATALSIYLGAGDLKLLHYNLVLTPRRVTSVRQGLVAIDHIPFNGYFGHCPELGSTVTQAGTHGALAPKGFMDSATRLSGSSFVKLRGWVANDNDTPYSRRTGKPRCIAIADASGVVRGLGVAGFSRPDVAAALNSDGSGFGWIGYVRPEAGSTTLFAYARNNTNGRWYRLHHALDIVHGKAMVR